MLSDVVAIARAGGDHVYTRPIYAGSSLAKVTLRGGPRLLTIRAAAFEPPVAMGQLARVSPVALDPARLPQGTRFLSQETRPSNRPELTDARLVVAGGQPLKDRESFDHLVTALADVLGGAVGATRAAVDAGIAPDDFQIGQTGKVIAADLYVALGISGAIQHLAGVKDARAIVAINKDPEAPIHGLATYSLVGDLFLVGPELIDKLQHRLSFRGT
jgi:electron transfer flavoprotein alpha subunit